MTDSCTISDGYFSVRFFLSVIADELYLFLKDYIIEIFQQSASTEKQYDFLFLGHLRKEKGIQVLLEAWKLFQPKHPKATLCIAGEAPFGFDKSACSGLNIDIILQFLSDEQYFNLGSTAHCIILPYTKGTNSGVVSTLVTLNSNIITPDLEMFKSNALLSKELMFESGNPHSLASGSTTAKGCI